MCTCPMCKFEILKCPQCGYATTFFPRHGPRGQGAHYSQRIKRLNPTHQLALQVLKEHGADCYEKGMGLTDIWLRVRDIVQQTRNAHMPTKGGISGRLSELQGLGMVKSQHNHVEIVDRDSMQ